MDYTSEQRSLLEHGKLGPRIERPDADTLKRLNSKPLGFCDPVSGVERRGVLQFEGAEVRFAAPNMFGGKTPPSAIRPRSPGSPN